ncbi:MAG: hypothetical protein IPO08_25135 [Xanthomonadales bacterium]|nr:hypothetical protein [Xanthomonadales bacterium]
MTEETNLQAETPAEGAPVLSDDTAEQVASPTTADETPEPEASADDAGKAEPKGVGKRIDELTRNWRQTERDRDYWRELAMRGQQAEKPADTAPPTAPVSIPTLAEFEYDENKYQAALLQYTEAVAERKVEAVLKAERDRQAQEATQKTWKQRESEFKAKTPDYETVAYYAPLSNEVVSLVVESEVGPELAYYLGKNPELAQTISQLPERAAAREIGKLESRLEAQRTTPKPAPAKPVVSQAPPPPPKIEAVEPDVRKSIYDEGLSMNEWLAIRNKQIARRKG